MTDKPHDHFFKFVFSQKEIVQDFIKYLITHLADKIDLESLEIDNNSYINTELQDFYSDIVYNVNTTSDKAVKIAFLLEHKSVPPEFPHVQINEYRQGIWRNDIASFKKKVKKKTAKRKARTLTHVIPVIFYHGKQRWRKKPFKEYFEQIDEAFNPYIPIFDYYLVDLNEYSDEFVFALKAGFLVNSLIAFKHKGETDYVKKHFRDIFVNLESRQIDESTKLFTLTLSAYIVTTTSLTANDVIDLSDKMPKKVKRNIMTGYESLIEMGKKQGIEQGIEIGTKRADEKNTLDFVIKLIKKGSNNEFILDLCEVSSDTLILLRTVISDDFKNTENQLKLANRLIKEYEYLNNEDIKVFTKLDVEEILKIKTEQSKE